jgi:hypothetical protein
MPRRRTTKYNLNKDVESDRDVDDVINRVTRVRKSAPSALIGNVSALLDKVSGDKIVTAADLGRFSALELIKAAKLTIMSKTVPANESQDAHKDIMEGRGGAQAPHRYGRKQQQSKPAME